MLPHGLSCRVLLQCIFTLYAPAFALDIPCYMFVIAYLTLTYNKRLSNRWADRPRWNSGWEFTRVVQVPTC